MKITKNDFGKLDDKRSVDLYTMQNDNGMSVSITNYGGIITKIIVEDMHGNFSDVTLGYDNLDYYLNDTPYFGAIIGRYGNRIADAQFTLNDIEYKLKKNDGENHLHGGILGFDKVLWDAESFADKNEVGLVLTYLSSDGEEGYPGNLSVEVIYTLTNSNEIIIEYKATTDKTTVCNLTNHAYFNLLDCGQSQIIDHKVKINSNAITSIDIRTLPTGDILKVENTPFDFREYTKIENVIDEDHEQIKNGIGFDHNFIINGSIGKLREAASVLEENSGRILTVLTTEPGIQFYTGNHLDGSLTGKENKIYNKRNGFCLETQHYPDSPNNENFPSTKLEPGEILSSKTIYKFSVLK